MRLLTCHAKSLISKGLWAQLPRFGQSSTRRYPSLPNETALNEAQNLTEAIKAAPFKVELNLSKGNVNGPLGSLSKLLFTEFDIGTFKIAIPNVILRDACECSKCLDPSTRQKLFETHKLDMRMRHNRIKQLKDGSFEVFWEPVKEIDGEEQHRSVYSKAFIMNNASNNMASKKSNHMGKPIHWDSSMMSENISHIPYQSYMETEEGLSKTLQVLQAYGLVFITDVPSDDTSGAVTASLARRIGPVQETIYGTTWDVKSTPDAKNIAYTSQNLPPHMDLLYYESPPGLQFLHCLRNEAKGGDSVFADSFRVLDEVKADQHVPTFYNQPFEFHYKNDGHYLSFVRSMVVTNPFTKEYDHVNYSPPFQATLKHVYNEKPMYGYPSKRRQKQFEQLFELYKTFGSLINDPKYLFTTRLEKGTCVIFQNRRVVHGRTEFDSASGERWFKGTYVGIDAFRVGSYEYD